MFTIRVGMATVSLWLIRFSRTWTMFFFSGAPKAIFPGVRRFVVFRAAIMAYFSVE
jgi:hypothetical protein